MRSSPKRSKLRYEPHCRTTFARTSSCTSRLLRTSRHGSETDPGRAWRRAEARGPNTSELASVSEPARGGDRVQGQHRVLHQVSRALHAQSLAIVVDRDPRRALEH